MISFKQFITEDAEFRHPNCQPGMYKVQHPVLDKMENLYKIKRDTAGTWEDYTSGATVR